MYLPDTAPAAVASSETFGNPATANSQACFPALACFGPWRVVSNCKSTAADYRRRFKSPGAHGKQSSLRRKSCTELSLVKSHLNCTRAVYRGCTRVIDRKLVARRVAQRPTFAHGYLLSLLKVYQPCSREGLAVLIVEIILVHPLLIPPPYHQGPSKCVHIIAAMVKWWFFKGM